MWSGMSVTNPLSALSSVFTENLFATYCFAVSRAAPDDDCASRVARGLEGSIVVTVTKLATRGMAGATALERPCSSEPKRFVGNAALRETNRSAAIVRQAIEPQVKESGDETKFENLHTSSCGLSSLMFHSQVEG